MVPRGIQVSKDTPFKEVIRQLQAHKKFCAVILEGSRVVGIFTERDALKRGLLKGIQPDAPIEKFMTANPDVIDQNDSLGSAIRIMHNGKHRHVPVVNSKQEFLGLISVRDVVLYLSENYPYEIYNQPPDPHKFSGAPEGA